MNLEARETARLYTLLTDKLGGDITEAMFKYIDNKTERSVEATIKTLATKEDMTQVRFDLSLTIGKVNSDLIQAIGKVNSDLSQAIGKVNGDLLDKMGESRAETIKWMFIFWIGQVAAVLAIVLLFVKK
jgi:DNA polymerase III delta prime subunit